MPTSESAPTPDSFRVVPQSSVTTSAADPDSFTGEVSRQEVLPATRPSGMRGHVFSYEPGARSHWHVHEGEQALVVVDGEGLVQWEGLDVPRRVRVGDWVHVVPGVAHWHGATPEHGFAHLAVTATGGTRWLDPVTDEDYLAPPASGEQLD
jgi:quercetin dioxygenase-like cupin family protein